MLKMARLGVLRGFRRQYHRQEHGAITKADTGELVSDCFLIVLTVALLQKC